MPQSSDNLFKIKRKSLKQYLKLKYPSKITNKILKELDFVEESIGYRTFIEKFRINLALAKRL